MLPAPLAQQGLSHLSAIGTMCNDFGKRDVIVVSRQAIRADYDLLRLKTVAYIRAYEYLVCTFLRFVIQCSALRATMRESLLI